MNVGTKDTLSNVLASEIFIANHTRLIERSAWSRYCLSLLHASIIDQHISLSDKFTTPTPNERIISIDKEYFELS